jgi:hypothetical protein
VHVGVTLIFSPIKQKTLSSRQGAGNEQDQESGPFPPPYCEAVVNPTRAGDLAYWQGSFSLQRLANIQLRDSAGLVHFLLHAHSTGFAMNRSESLFHPIPPVPIRENGFSGWFIFQLLISG